ncbi:MAG: DUF2794 domain-containing protein [Alphaproteobacteria bacterium]|jgi:hypothetical protein
MNNLKNKRFVGFQKREIHTIMELYSKKISIGEWKDYSISYDKECAIFSIHRSIKQGSSFQIKKIKKKNTYVLTYQNTTLAVSSSLLSIIDHLKKPVLRIIK